MPSVEDVPCPVVDEMSVDDLKKLHQEMGTSPEALRRDAVALREWINAEPHLPNVTEDLDKWLATFLTTSKNSMEKAKVRLDNYFTNRNVMAAWFVLPPPPEDMILADDSEFMTGGYVPRVLPNGYILCLEKAVMPPDGKWSRFDMSLHFRRSLLIVDALLAECKNLRGAIYCIDQQHVNLEVITCFLSSLSGFRKTMAIIQDAMPLRLHAIHLTNAVAPNLQKMLLGAVTPLLKGKLAERIHIHADNTSLHEYIPREYLPAEYGGTDTYSMDGLSTSLTNYVLGKRDWFESRQWMKTDETRRLIKKPTSDLGVEGSFRQLTVD